MAQIAFDASGIETRDATRFDLIPNGWQPAQAIASDLNPTKSGNGTIVSFTWEVMAGPFKGRQLWTRHNLQNINAQAQEIGRRELAEICKAIGISKMNATEDAHFKPLMVRVGLEKPEEGREPRNAVKGFKQYANALPTAAAPSSAPASAPSMPWAAAAQ